VRAGWTVRVTTCVRVVSEREKSSLCFGSREKRDYTMPPRRERQSPDREDRDARRRGRPAGNPEIERQMRDLRARLEEMETAQRRGVVLESSVIPRWKRKLDTMQKRSQQRMLQPSG
jgi:hypothetical protein